MEPGRAGPLSVLCLDASFLVNALTAKLTDEHEALWVSWLAAERPMIAPRLARYEVANALHKARRKGKVDEPLVQRAMRELVALPISMPDDDALPFEALAIADTLNMPATYDAHYVALAARYGAEQWTSDHGLWSAASPRFPQVHYAPERLPGT